MVKQNKKDCIQLMEETHELLNAIIIVHVKSDTNGELPPTVSKYIRIFTEFLYSLICVDTTDHYLEPCTRFIHLSRPNRKETRSGNSSVRGK
jgi:hypothetical protein